MATIKFPYRRLADQFHKVARSKATPEEHRRLGSLIDRNFEEIERRWPDSELAVIIVPISDEITPITTGTAKRTFRMPFAMTVTAVRASLTIASSSGTPTFDINEGGATILSTKLTIDASEETSTTAATPAVISDPDLADNAEITIDVDTAGTGAAGAKIYIIGTTAVA